jgi:hypothetical protein
MRNIKTYESYSMNETMDMMFFPVDVIAGQKEVYADLMAGLKSKFAEFVDGGSQVIDETVKSLGPKSSEALRNAQDFFGKPAESISYDDVMAALEEEGLMEGESFMDRYDRADAEINDVIDGTTDKVKGGPAQKTLKLMGDIFVLNVFTIGSLGTFVTWALGNTVNPALSMVYSIIAWIIIQIIRKLIVAVKG